MLSLTQGCHPQLGKPSSEENQTSGKTPVCFLGGESQPHSQGSWVDFSLLFPSSTGNYWVKDVGGEDRKGRPATSRWRGPPDVALGARLPSGTWATEYPEPLIAGGRSIALLEAGSSGCSMAGSLRRCVNSLLYTTSLVAG